MVAWECRRYQKRCGLEKKNLEQLLQAKEKEIEELKQALSTAGRMKSEKEKERSSFPEAGKDFHSGKSGTAIPKRARHCNSREYSLRVRTGRLMQREGRPDSSKGTAEQAKSGAK